MADVSQVVRQWLETDAALGVTEVPIVRHIAKGDSDVAERLAIPAPAPKSKPAVIAPASPLATPPPAPEAAFVLNGLSSEKVSAARKPAAPVFAAPTGKVSELAVLTTAQKVAALRALYEELEKESAGRINDISTRLVFGEGDPDAQLMFVGEGPGAEEDRTGRPFVGRSGQLLDKMIAAIGYKREQVYIGNVVKLRCAEWANGASGRRLQDRPPTPEEACRGLPFLHRQIEIIRPKVIVTLGAPAIRHLTGTTEGVMKIRGHWLDYRGVPVMPTYHPSFVLRAYTEENRRKVWSDLKEAAKRIAEGR